MVGVTRGYHHETAGEPCTLAGDHLDSIRPLLKGLSFHTWAEINACVKILAQIVDKHIIESAGLRHIETESAQATLAKEDRDTMQRR
jgi:hypothetical protein